MEKKVMIAVDDSRHSNSAVRYAAGLYGVAKDVTYTLLHVQPTVSQYLVDEAKKNPRAYAELENLNRRNHKAAHQLLETYKEQMTGLGVPEEVVQAATQPRLDGVARDILEFGLAGSFDALILGRRGLSGLQEVLIGSVSANVVNHSTVIPVWLVDDKGTSKNILVAVDGSENALKAADHLAFMMQGNTDVKISFFHMTPRLKDFCPVDLEEVDTDVLEEILQEGNRSCIDRFFSRAKNRLGEAGIQPHQISVNISEGLFRVGKTVLDQYEKGGFGTLVIGRRGVHKKYFTGSVSRYLINQFAQGALWVVP